MKKDTKIIGDTKWEKIYDDVYETIIWRYDLSKNKTGPYEVEIKSKNPRSTPKPVTSRKLTKKTT